MKHRGNRAARIRHSWHPRERDTIINADDFRMAIERLTNWQRHAWVDAGYPGSRNRDAGSVMGFIENLISCGSFD